MADGTVPAPIFAGRLRAARERRGWTQAQLAEHTGLHPAACSHYETGERTPSIENLVTLADALAVSTDHLLGRSDLAEQLAQAWARIRDLEALLARHRAEIDTVLPRVEAAPPAPTCEPCCGDEHPRCAGEGCTCCGEREEAPQKPTATRRAPRGPREPRPLPADWRPASGRPRLTLEGIGFDYERALEAYRAAMAEEKRATWTAGAFVTWAKGRRQSLPKKGAEKR